MHILTGSLALRRLARVSLTTAVMTGMWAGAALAESDKVWTVIKSSGSAEVQRPTGNWTALKPGARVIPGHRIRTGPSSSVELKQNGDSMTVAPNSRARIAVKKAGSKTADVKQSLGTLLFKIVKRPEGAQKFRVSTPYLAAVIKGTTFSVTVNATGAALHVAKGLVQVQSRLSRGVALVRPGQTAAVSSTRGTRLKVTGGKPKADNAAAIRGSGGKPEEASKDSNSNGASAKAVRNAGKGVIKNAIGGGGINVLKATKGLVENHGAAVGHGRGNTKSGNAKVAATGNSGNVQLPSSVKKALKSVAKSTSAAKANANNGNGNGNGKGKGKGKKK